MKIKNKRKFICRLTILLVLITTIILTPISINYANITRGYKGYGGEYLVPVLGLIIAMVIETVYQEELEKTIKKELHHDNESKM